jgi:glucokinase-like ROK family protein
MKIDKTVINTLNKKNVLDLIRSESPVSRADLSRMTGLSLPTIMKITDELVDIQLAVEVGKGVSSGGKPPTLLEFRSNAFNLVGVEVSATEIVALLMDLRANILGQVNASFRIDATPEQLIQTIIETTRQVISQTGVEQESVLGVGIGIPALVDREAGKILFAPDWNWESVEIAGPVQQALQCPVRIDNVVRAYAVGEQWFGLGMGLSNFMCIYLGYGIGSAVVLNGELYSGSSGSAGEIGHMTLDRHGPLCDCGNYGCLEALASSYAIARKAQHYIQRGEPTQILALAGGQIEAVDARDVYQAAKNGDSLALEIIQEATEYLGMAIANAINLFDPERIIIEGEIAREGALLASRVQKYVDRNQLKHAGRQVKIIFSQLEKATAAIGAASFILKEFIATGGNRNFRQKT